MGLFLDFNPEDMIGMDQNLDDQDLEAELAAITGTTTTGGDRSKQKVKSKYKTELGPIWAYTSW